MPQPGNVAAILEWCKLYRPDMTDYVEKIVNMPGEQGAAFCLLMTSSFEAGRMFQSQFEDPARYNIHEVPY